MLSDVTKYSGLHAKIKAMESNLLQYDDYENLAAQPDIMAFAKTLAEKSVYREALSELTQTGASRIPLERSLVQSMYQDFSRIYSFMTDVNEKKYLDIYFLKYEIGLVKALLRMLFDQRDIRNMIPKYDNFFTKHLKIGMEKLVASSSIQDFISNLEGTEFYKVLKKENMENPSLFSFEMQLDFYSYMQIWRYQQKYLSKTNINAQKHINGADIDMHNIAWIYRAKKYYETDTSMIYTYLIPISYRLSKKELDDMVQAENQADLLDAISKTKYKKLLIGLENGTLEKQYYIEMRRIHEMEEKKNPYSLSTVTSYLYKKGHEIRNLTTLIECVRYDLKPEVAMTKLSFEPKRDSS